MKVDHRNPNYSAIYEQRAKRLRKLRENPKFLPALREHYRTAPWDFINDWGHTFEPRNIEVGRPASIPFVLWQRQREYLEWIYAKWQNQERGLVEKSRDCGVTWLSAGFAVSMWLFEPGFTIGFGSRKEDLVDLKGDPDSIFEKIRLFIGNLPKEFLPAGFSVREHCAHMRVKNPVTEATISGEAGDQIGRGGRKSIYFVDEAAFIDHQDLVDAALSQNTNCQIDISTPNGNGNAFYKKRMRFNNTDKVFVFDWREDPRKDDAWYAKQLEEYDEVTVAQEIDRDYNASAEDAFIPAKWVVAAIDAHKKLGFRGEGLRVTGFDPADVGDAKAVVNRHGSVICQARQLKAGDITHALPWAFDQADDFRADVLGFDGDGMGAPAMKVQLSAMAGKRVNVIAYHGSAAVLDPKKTYDGAKTHKRKERRTEDLHAGLALKSNEDSFLNFRAQTWTWARDRFEATFHAVERANEGFLVNIDPEDLISIDSGCECLTELQAELSRPRRLWTNNGKIKVESKPDMKKRGVDSPNLADAAVIAISIHAPKEQARKPIRVRRHKIRDRAVGY